VTGVPVCPKGTSTERCSDSCEPSGVTGISSGEYALGSSGTLYVGSPGETLPIYAKDERIEKNRVENVIRPLGCKNYLFAGGRQNGVILLRTCTLQEVDPQ